MKGIINKACIVLAGLLVMMGAIGVGYPSPDEPDAAERYIELHPEARVELTVQERQFLDSLGVLKVMVDEKYPPISYYDATTKTFGGISVDVLAILSKTLGFDYQIIHDPDLLWADRLNMIRDDKIDILCGASVNDERKQYGYFSDKAYFAMNYAVIGTVNHHIRLTAINNIARYRIGLVKGMAINDYIVNIAGDRQIVYYPTFQAALAALKAQEVDLTLGNEAVFTEEYFKGNHFEFEILFSIYDAVKQYAFFCPRTDDGKKLAAILSKGMNQINLDEVISAHYQYKSIFAYYKEYMEKLQRANTVRNIVIAVLIVCSVSCLLIVLLIRSRNKDLKRLSLTDYLTGLKNRNALFQEFANVAKLSGQVVAYLDLDRFKRVNDSYGHEAGDRVLAEIAQRLQTALPAANIYRMGGDEFLIIVAAAALPDTEALLTIINKPITADRNVYQVGASIGYVDIAGFQAGSLNEVIHAADGAMLAAKALGENQSVKYSAAIAKGEKRERG